MQNKIAPPFRDTEFDIMFDSGISYEGDLIDLATSCDVVEKSGAWLNYGDDEFVSAALDSGDMTVYSQSELD